MTKTKTTHTPGPWEALKCQRDWAIVSRGRQAVDLANDRAGISEVATVHAYNGDMDARLIAAAPELLEIVRSCLALPTNSGGRAFAECARLRQAARAAIAKTEGGEVR